MEDKLLLPLGAGSSACGRDGESLATQAPMKIIHGIYWKMNKKYLFLKENHTWCFASPGQLIISLQSAQQITGACRATNSVVVCADLFTHCIVGSLKRNM